MDSEARAQARINNLINQDKQTDSTIDNQFEVTMDFIRYHLMAFYQRYADDNGLSVSQTSQQVNQWDIQQWRDVLKRMNITSWEQEAQDRAKVLSAQAGINKTNLINAIIGLGLLNLTNQQITTIGSRLNSDNDEAIEDLRQELNLTSAQVAILRNLDDGDDWQDNFWLASDGIRNNVEITFNNSLRAGLTQIALGTLLAVHFSNKEKRPNKSIADRIGQLVNSAKGYVRTYSSIQINRRKTKAYKYKPEIKQVKWITEPGCCKLCASIQRSNPYDKISAPIPGLDSHPYCRCTIIPIRTHSYDDTDEEDDD
ncbi:hypothetical protein M8332_06840 (plasmid) [Fructilactobacillus ixorae]|uniref:Phage head morphogenesis domain-containing protein n=1 Tax=Fructilactobacillus ixorae TaxID=1750535 RepID=A0ABY5C778_9LACO|nr:hypothetical protein [Fructilactobacillus ixorae]USS93998.1 hypothetical protein M8332_06840 [Fructilactobacillus ixorae]